MNRREKLGQGLFVASAALILLSDLYLMGHRFWWLWKAQRAHLVPEVLMPLAIFVFFSFCLWFAYQGKKWARVTAGAFQLAGGTIGITYSLYLYLIVSQREYLPALIRWEVILQNVFFAVIPALFLLFSDAIARFQAYQRGETDDHEASLSAIGSK